MEFLIFLELFLYKKFREAIAEERYLFWKALSGAVGQQDGVELRDIISEFREYEKVILDRRNIFWSLYTRVSLAILVVSLIALLISACKIESQAGLPIISGIIAFIIGQGSELIHAAGTPTLLVRAEGGGSKGIKENKDRANQNLYGKGQANNASQDTIQGGGENKGNY